MDKTTAKLLLECCRPQDREDPLFVEALREAAADPELGAWFAENQRLDEILAAKFQEITVPADLKSHILLGRQAGLHASEREAAVPPAGKQRKRWVVRGSVAALLLAGLISSRLLRPPREQINPLALQAISYTDQMPRLQFVCFDPAAVAGWINQQPGSRKVGLTLPTPADGHPMTMIGSSMVDWNGHPVVMICLQNGKRMAMLYVMKAGDEAGPGEPQEGSSETVQHADWVVRTTKAGGQMRVLATKGKPEDLDFPMPF